MGAPQVKEILSRINEIHERKNHDYAQENDPFSNFKRAAVISEWFKDPVDKVFAVMMGIKLARLAELLNGKIAKNESTDDSFLDLDTYSILWHSWFLHQQEYTRPVDVEMKKPVSRDVVDPRQPKPLSEYR